MKFATFFFSKTSQKKSKEDSINCYKNKIKINKLLFSTIMVYPGITKMYAILFANGTK